MPEFDRKYLLFALTTLEKHARQFNAVRDLLAAYDAQDAKITAMTQESDGWKRAYKRALEQAQEHIDKLTAARARIEAVEAALRTVRNKATDAMQTLIVPGDVHPSRVSDALTDLHGAIDYIDAALTPPPPAPETRDE